MDNNRAFLKEEFQQMLDFLASIKKEKKHNNYIWMFITKKYKYFILLILIYYFYKNYKKIKQILVNISK